MTKLSLDIRNTLARDPALRRLLGRSATWDTWIFDERPIGVHMEGTSRCLVVINEEGQWAAPNEHNTMRFPQIYVDIWADPTRNPDGSTKISDAKVKIETIQKVIDRHLHLVDPGTSSGLPTIFGTEEQVATRTGSVIAGSHRRSGPDYSEIRDAEDAWMGRLIYGVNAL